MPAEAQEVITGEGLGTEASSAKQMKCKKAEQKPDPVALISSTLQRRSDDNPENAWDEPSGDTFMVRGPTYLDDRIKITNGSSCYKLLGLDLFTSNTPIRHVSSVPQGSLVKARKRGLKDFVFTINYLLPWGSFVCYFIPNRSPQADEANLEPWLIGDKTIDPLLHRFFCEEDDDFRTERLKIIPVVVEGSWLLKKVVKGKPSLLCTKITTQWHQHLEKDKNYVEAEVDINSSRAALSILGLVKSGVKSVALDMAFTIEGRHPSELPERILGAIRFCFLDPTKAPLFDSFTADVEDDDARTEAEANGNGAGVAGTSTDAQQP